MEDITDGSSVLLQRGAVIAGEVTWAGPAEIEGETRQLLAVEPRELRADGRVYPIEAKVVAADPREDRELFTTRNLAILGGSTVAGTLLGELLLDDPLLGAVLGAAGGSVIAVATSDTEIELGRGAVLTVELEERVRPTVTDR